MAKGFSNLDLNGPTPARVQPKVGSWGPAGVVTTRRKKVLRVLAVVAFVVAFAALVGWSAWIYFQVFKPQG